MNWDTTREDVIARWGQVQATLESEQPVDLVAEVEALAALCAKTNETAGQPATGCDLCAAFRDVGGCGRVGSQITAALRAADWDRARVYVDEVLQMLRSDGPRAV